MHDSCWLHAWFLLITCMILVDYMHDACWLHAWCFLMKHMMLIDQTHNNAWFRSLYDALECSTLISRECLMMLDTSECSAWISCQGFDALECLILLGVTWCCLMSLDDAWWCLMMLDDAWWRLMTLDFDDLIMFWGFDHRVTNWLTD